jgi:hypothetical protein
VRESGTSHLLKFLHPGGAVDSDILSFCLDDETIAVVSASF